ncbi:MAG: DUF5668 domain-containing protein [Patescibacteria group bacterium]
MEEQKTEQNQTQNEVKKEEPSVEPKEIHYHHHYDKRKGWDMGRFFWALILLFAGIAFLGNNFGWFSVNMENIWRFWPVILIVIALSMLTRRGIMGTIFGGIVVILIVGGIVFSTIFWPDTNREVKTYEFSETLVPEITSGEVTLDAGAGNLTIKGGSQFFIAGQLDSNITELTTTKETTGGKLTYSLTTKANRHWSNWFGSSRNDLAVNLTDKVPLELTLGVGAMDMNLDFSQVMLSKLEINSGATSAEIKFGNLVEDVTFTLETGASSTDILLPKDVGAKVKIDSGVSSKDLSDFEKLDDNTYQSENYDQTTKKIEMNVDMGAASLNIDWY